MTRIRIFFFTGKMAKEKRRRCEGVGTEKKGSKEERWYRRTGGNLICRGERGGAFHIEGNQSDGAARLAWTLKRISRLSGVKRGGRKKGETF